MLATSQLGYTTEVSVDWSRVTELYESIMTRIRTEFDRADDLTMLGAHSSHSYQTGTNLYFVYDYVINCAPREEIELYHKPLNAIIVEEALRARRVDGASPRRGQVPHAVGRRGTRQLLRPADHAEAGLRPERNHERRNADPPVLIALS